MNDPTDAQVYEAFTTHVKKLETLAVAGDKDAIRSLACMALLAEGWKPEPDGGGEVITFRAYRMRMAA